MSFPTFAAQKFVDQKIPTANTMVPCMNEKQYGDLTLVINGKDYKLDNDEWTFPAQDLKLVQNGEKTQIQEMHFKMGLLGP